MWECRSTWYTERDVFKELVMVIASGEKTSSMTIW